MYAGPSCASVVHPLARSVDARAGRSCAEDDMALRRLAREFVSGSNPATVSRGIASSVRALATAATETLSAELRVDGGGTTASNKLRREGRVPGVIFAPGEESKTLISLCSRELSAALRRHTLAGMQCTVFDVELQEEGESSLRKVRALAKQVQMHAYNQLVNNVCLLEVDPETVVKVNVPVQTQGDDVSPGVKRGGFIQVLRRTIAIACRSDSIPSSFVMDVSNLDAGKIIKIRDLNLPEGVTLRESDAELPMIRIGGKVKSA